GDCNCPVGVLAKIDNGKMKMRAQVFLGESAAPRQAEAEGACDEGEKLADELLQRITREQEHDQEYQTERNSLSGWRCARRSRIGDFARKGVYRECGCDCVRSLGKSGDDQLAEGRCRNYLCRERSRRKSNPAGNQRAADR